ncbi:MAG: hypothetical protein MPW15_19090 [Candidatus Manganitrophus sp.]|nr:hypothetical protein [Candidatus Manganitrophus sp.]
MEKIFSLGVEPVGVPGQEDPAEAADPPKRGPQIVRDGVAERFQLFVGRFQLGGPLRDPPLQILVEFLDLFFGPFPFGDIDSGRDKINYFSFRVEHTAPFQSRS